MYPRLIFSVCFFRLSEIRTQQQSKGSTVFSEAPFKSLRDAVSKLLFRSVFSASLAPDVFVNSSVQRVPSSSTSVKHEIEPVFQSSDEGANPNSVNECKNDDTKREDINVEPATEIKQKDGKQEFEFDEKQDSMKILKKRFHRDLVPSLDLIEPSKRRRLGTLGELSLGLQQRMKGNIENIWKAVVSQRVTYSANQFWGDRSKSIFDYFQDSLINYIRCS